ncbi:MAG: aldo/keto reductase [Eggerthellaceae bacterium]|nr:aldo/keto reductase [Eggerthellaceae bacterium]
MAYLGEEIPKLGFGLMRLPEIEKDGEKAIDIEQVKEMVDAFLGAGFMYFDTAFGYHGGMSEVAIKTALVDRYPRESFQLATKLPAWMAKDADAAKAMLATSLARTGAGYFDFYLLHNIGAARAKFFDDYGIWDFVHEQKEKGIIKHLGFSFHDKAALLEEVLKAHPEVEFVQLQINYADWESPVVESRKCYEVARAAGKPVVIMEPVKGGSLAKLPESVAAIFQEADPQAPLPSWALRFAASLDGLVTVLSGMSTIGQMQENLAVMRNFKPLSPAERLVVERAQQALQAIPHVPCTDCRYCMKDCSVGIQIPGVLGALNTYLTYGDLEAARRGYFFSTMGVKASACIECGNCERVCTQQIAVISELKRAVELLEV